LDRQRFEELLRVVFAADQRLELRVVIGARTDRVGLEV
jgi:hypothetical protein